MPHFSVLQPSPFVVWRFQGKQVGEGEILNLFQVTRQDGGEYICTAENRVGPEAEARLLLVVSYLPEIRAERPHVHCGPGHPFRLCCRVRARPRAKVSWQRDGRIIERSDGVEIVAKGGRSCLHVAHMKEGDFGQYTCEASNTLGSSKDSIIVVGTPEAPVLGPAAVYRGSDPLGSGQLTLGWKTLSFSPVLQHEVLIQQKDDYLDNWEELEVTPKEQPRDHRFQASLSNLLPNSTYMVRIRARNRRGWSPLSKLLEFETTSKTRR